MLKNRVFVPGVVPEGYSGPQVRPEPPKKKSAGNGYSSGKCQIKANPPLDKPQITSWDTSYKDTVWIKAINAVNPTTTEFFICIEYTKVKKKTKHTSIHKLPVASVTTDLLGQKTVSFDEVKFGPVTETVVIDKITLFMEQEDGPIGKKVVAQSLSLKAMNVPKSMSNGDTMVMHSFEVTFGPS